MIFFQEQNIQATPKAGNAAPPSNLDVACSSACTKFSRRPFDQGLEPHSCRAAPAPAECARPIGKAPVVLQGATASEEEMRDVHTKLQAQVKVLEAYYVPLW